MQLLWFFLPKRLKRITSAQKTPNVRRQPVCDKRRPASSSFHRGHERALACQEKGWGAQRRRAVTETSAVSQLRRADVQRQELPCSVFTRPSGCFRLTADSESRPAGGWGWGLSPLLYSRHCYRHHHLGSDRGVKSGSVVYIRVFGVLVVLPSRMTARILLHLCMGNRLSGALLWVQPCMATDLY